MSGQNSAQTFSPKVLCNPPSNAVQRPGNFPLHFPPLDDPSLFVRGHRKCPNRTSRRRLPLFISWKPRPIAGLHRHLKPVHPPRPRRSSPRRNLCRTEENLAPCFLSSENMAQVNTVLKRTFTIFNIFFAVSSRR